jgi:hypothetical protein
VVTETIDGMDWSWEGFSVHWHPEPDERGWWLYRGDVAMFRYKTRQDALNAGRRLLRRKPIKFVVGDNLE